MYFKVDKVIDLKNYENEGIFLEGTGSIVFDHPYKKAYACLSSRTSIVLLKKVCVTLGYESVTFEAFDEFGQGIIPKLRGHLRGESAK